MNESVYSSDPWLESMCAANPDAHSSSPAPSTAGELNDRTAGTTATETEQPT